jgi:molybdate transport system substrate-binding protein
VRRVGLLVVAALLLTACARTSATPTGSPATSRLSGELLVFAAASLTDAFDEVAEAFTAQHPDLSVTYNLAGSQVLATQITEGAPADVLASANAAQLDVVAQAVGVDGEPQVFATNALEIAVEPGNPLGIAGLGDLARDDVVLVLPAEEVPAGRYAVEALAAAGVTVSPSSLENDVRAALARVELGEADAAIVYRSDVVAAGSAVEGVEIPEAQNVLARYPVAALAEAPNPEAAAAFVEFLLDEEAQQILGRFGFGPP